MNDQEYLLNAFTRSRILAAHNGNYEEAQNLIDDCHDANRMHNDLDPELLEYLKACSEKHIDKNISLAEAFNIKKPSNRPKQNLTIRNLMIAAAVFSEVENGAKVKGAIDSVTLAGTLSRQGVESAYYKHRAYVQVLRSLSHVGQRTILPLRV